MWSLICDQIIIKIVYLIDYIRGHANIRESLIAPPAQSHHLSRTTRTLNFFFFFYIPWDLVSVWLQIDVLATLY